MAEHRTVICEIQFSHNAEKITKQFEGLLDDPVFEEYVYGYILCLHLLGQKGNNILVHRDGIACSG
jgi:hypothetical protein